MAFVEKLSGRRTAFSGSTSSCSIGVVGIRCNGLDSTLATSQTSRRVSDTEQYCGLEFSTVGWLESNLLNAASSTGRALHAQHLGLALHCGTSQELHSMPGVSQAAILPEPFAGQNPSSAIRRISLRPH